MGLERLPFRDILGRYGLAWPLPGRNGCGSRVHTIPVSLAASTAATRSCTRSFLVAGNLRFRLAHRGHLPCLTGGIEAGDPGVPVGGHQARNTIAAAYGVPAGKDAAGVICQSYGLAGETGAELLFHAT